MEKENEWRSRRNIIWQRAEWSRRKEMNEEEKQEKMLYEKEQNEMVEKF